MKVELVAITPEPEKVIETAARTCYQSQDMMNPDNLGKLLPKLLSGGHESPFEHAYATFRLTDVSRAMTHQLVRHRLMAVSQKSQRYVSEKNFEFVIPPSVAQADVEEFKRDMLVIRDMYVKWKDRGLKNEDARFVLPNACTSEIMVSANFREFRHIFSVRCTRHAQWEIREACLIMLDELHRRAPLVFQDLHEQFRGVRPQDA
ncbi:MAG: FAD-dependent thymidylate synthase [bacterium]